MACSHSSNSCYGFIFERTLRNCSKLNITRPRWWLGNGLVSLGSTPLEDVDPDLCGHMALRGHDRLNPPQTNFRAIRIPVFNPFHSHRRSQGKRNVYLSFVIYFGLGNTFNASIYKDKYLPRYSWKTSFSAKLWYRDFRATPDSIYIFPVLFLSGLCMILENRFKRTSKDVFLSKKSFLIYGIMLHYTPTIWLQLSSHALAITMTS